MNEDVNNNEQENDYSSFMPKENQEPAATPPADEAPVEPVSESSSTGYGFERENTEIVWVSQKVNELRRELPSNVFLNDYIPNEEVLKILGQSKYFFCKPVWPEPSGRLAAEAFLSGCEMITNDRVGTWSFDFYPNNKERAKQEMKETPQLFWDNVSRILKQNETENVPDLGHVLVYKSYGGLGDIFFCLPSLINLKEVSKSVSFAVHPSLVSFFT